MLRHYNLPLGTFKRYVGNRIHVLFHLAGVLQLHWSKLKEFVQLQSTAGEFFSSLLTINTCCRVVHKCIYIYICDLTWYKDCNDNQAQKAQPDNDTSDSSDKGL